MLDVTAIIPTTGSRPELLRRALASVHAQLHPPKSILVVLDGDSADVPALRGTFNANVEVACTGARSGVSAARNLGAHLAKTNMLAFLDDDDAWKPSYLACALEQEADLVLTAFEKHTPTQVAPEKIPPEVLSPDAFLVRNPGLRGSNLIITRDAYDRVGGFDPALPAFNDLDFGVRLADTGPWRYRRVLEPLVEFHSHTGARLSTAGSDANRTGLVRYWSRYRARMTEAQRSAFRARALQIWGLDPEELCS